MDSSHNHGNAARGYVSAARSKSIQSSSTIGVAMTPTNSYTHSNGGHASSSYSRQYEVVVPTSDDVNPHTMAPVDRVVPYDYKKHVKGNMQRKLEQRRDQISSEVAHRLEESFGIAALVPQLNTNNNSHANRGGGSGSSRGGSIVGTSSVTASSPPRIPKPPSFTQGTASSPMPHADYSHSPSSPQRSAIYSPITAHGSPRRRPNSSPSARGVAASSAVDASLLSQYASSLNGTFSNEDKLLRLMTLVNNSNGQGNRGASISTASTGTAAGGQRGASNNNNGEGGVSPRTGSPIRPATASHLSATRTRSAAIVGPTLPMPTLTTRPSPAEVAAAMALLRERGNNSPVKGVPFVSAGSVSHTNAIISGYGNSSGRASALGGGNGPPRPPSASFSPSRPGTATSARSTAAGGKGVGPYVPPSREALGVREEGAASVGGHNDSATVALEDFSRQHLHSPRHLKASWAGATADGPQRKPNINVLQQQKQSGDEGKPSYGGAGLGAGSGLDNPTDITLSWMLLGEMHKQGGPVDAEASAALLKRMAASTGHPARDASAHGGPSCCEALSTPRAPLLRHQCHKADATYLPTRSATARRKQLARQRVLEEKKELERIAAATVRMQADHAHRSAMRQRRYLQGLALQQPFEVAHFKKVVGAEWAAVEEERTVAVVDDIPTQVLVQHRRAEGGTVDRLERGALVERAVQSAHHTRFEREASTPRQHYSPRRELL